MLKLKSTINSLPLIILNVDKLRVNKMAGLLSNLNNLKVSNMTFKLGSKSRERLKGVDPRIIDIVELALTITIIDFGIPQHGGIRDKATQNILFKKGASKCDGIKSRSAHQSGLAFDVFAYVDGAASWDRYQLTQVAAAILQAASLLGYELEWGGLYQGFVDMPHFQLKG